MKNYTVLNRELISFENNDIKTAKVIRNQYDIDYYWVIIEDGELFYDNKTYNVKKGDVVFLLYQYKDEKQHRDLIITHIPELLHYQEMRDLYISTKKDNVNPCKSEY